MSAPGAGALSNETYFRYLRRRGTIASPAQMPVCRRLPCPRPSATLAEIVYTETVYPTVSSKLCIPKLWQCDMGNNEVAGRDGDTRIGAVKYLSFTIHNLFQCTQFCGAGASAGANPLNRRVTPPFGLCRLCAGANALVK